MKKITLSISVCAFLILCSVFEGLCQKINSGINNGVDTLNTNTYIVEYNFQKGKYAINNLKVKVGTPVSFKISNINRLAYSINVTAADSVLAETHLSNFPFTSAELSLLLSKNKTSLPGVTATPTDQGQGNNVSSDDIAASITKPKSTEKKIDAEVQAKVEIISNDIKSIFKSTELANEIASVQEQIKTLQDNLNNLKDSLNKYSSDSLNIVNSLSATTDAELVKKLTTQKGLIDLTLVPLRRNFSVSKVLIDKLTSDKDSLQSKLSAIKQSEYEGLKKFKIDNDKFIVAFEKLKSSYYNSKKAIQLYREVKVVSDNPLLSQELYQTKYKKDFDTIKVHLPYYKKAAGEFRELYSEVEDLYKNLQYNPLLNEVLNYGGQVKLYAYSKGAKEMADKMNATLKQIDVLSLLDRLDQTILFLEMPDAFNVIFAPIQPLNDAVVFDVRINKRDGNASDLHNNLNFKHKEYTYGGTRIDFSLGLAGSYFNNTPVYELSTTSVANSEASIVTIAQKSNNLSVPSLVGLATMSYRSTRYIAYGASAGLGIDVMNGKIQLSNFYAGPSMIFGKYERLTLTGGATVRNVGQLISGYEVGTVVKGTVDKISNFISDKYKVGMFLSLSFNLTKGVKDNIKQLKTFL